MRRLPPPLSLRSGEIGMKRFVVEIYDVNDIFSELEEARKHSREKDVSAVLVHVYLGVQGRYLVDRLLNEIEQCLPRALIVGCSSGGEILDGRLTDQAIVISVSVFYKTEVSIHAYPVKAGQEEEVGEEIRKLIDATPDVKAAELLIDCWSLDVSVLFSAINRCSQRVKIFGASPYSHDSNREPMFVFSGAGVKETSVVVVAYAGKDFHVTMDYAIGWKPLGVQMRVTKAEGRMLYTIDDKPAFDIYDKYLKIPNDEHFYDNVFEFPLLLYTHNTYVLRMPFACDENGAFTMIAAVPEGVSVFMSYGDPDAMLAEVAECARRVAKFHPEQIFLYSCAVRKAFWKRNVNNEMKPFQRIADSAGFFTGGEILRVNGELVHFNATLLVVGMREGEPSQAALLSESGDKQEFTAPGRVSLVKRMATFITEAMRELQKAAVTDELTQLFNRREMNQRIRRCQEEGRVFSLVMLDIDNFKKVNDTWGHDVGDVVLKDISNLIRSSVEGRDRAIAGRWGGEEFMILLPSTDQEAAAAIAENLRQEVERRLFETAGPMTISIGVVDSHDCSQMNVLYRDVDEALYEAKNSGKNRVVVKTHKRD